MPVENRRTDGRMEGMMDGWTGPESGQDPAEVRPWETVRR